jgi:hypothetical protein
MPKSTDHPDAAIFALAEQCAAAAKALDEARAAYDQAEKRCRDLVTPPVIVRTEKDKQLGLYVGNRVGTAYGRDDIPALYALVRANSVITDASQKDDITAWSRACEILDALRDLKAEEAREGFRSGLTEAKRRDHEAADVYYDLVERLALTLATTVNGAFAKTRVMRSMFLDDDEEEFGERFVNDLTKRMRRQGLDDEAFAMSLARDPIHLADKGSVQQ